jgi:cellulose synthase/poly-beta-1,6-N-acetylglucosamine synthase-like glycosyltransferase
MNDIKEKAVNACLNQNYPNFAVYVLDDSSSDKEQQIVDSLQRKYENKLFVIRRKTRSGYKAGNLNNALKQIGKAYTYVCIVDSDEIIPITFLRDLVSILEKNENLGFVQAAHHQYSETDYGKYVGDNIDLHWKYFLPARNLFGFVYSYGHGVLLRTKVLLEIGGFPEIVSEDIAVSTKIRESGYKGYYAYDVESLEEVPPSYQAFRRRNKKIVGGTLEFFYKYSWQFFRAKNISIIEKMDLFLTLSVIYLPILFLFYVLATYAIILSGNNLKMTTIFNNIHFLSYFFFTIFAPLVYLIPNLIKSPLRVLMHILRMGTVYLSTCVQTAGITVKWLMDKKTSFVPTGDRIHVNSSNSPVVESLIGLGFIVIGTLTTSLYLIAIGLSLIFVVFMVKSKEQRKFTLFLLPIPILITLIALFGAPVSLVLATGAIFTGVVWAFF